MSTPLAPAAGAVNPHWQAWLQRQWWQPRPTTAARLMQPLSWVYGTLARSARRRTQPQHAPVPVLVVGNLIVGGAGKTPTVIALVQALQARGHRPGVVSRGYGRAGDALVPVHAGDSAAQAGDEPLLIRRRTGVPVWVARHRAAAAQALCRAHPEVDVLISDDGLQHHALARDAELIVFDDRGAGNGLLLPAGPLREPLPSRLQAHQRVLYTGRAPSTPLPGTVAQRMLRHAVPLTEWLVGGTGVPLQDLRRTALLAAAGLAAPEKFFAMLRAGGLNLAATLPLPDHHAFAALPWPAGTPDVIVTEKDAVKIDPAATGATRVWVAPLDLQLPDTLVNDLTALLFNQPRP